jgi:autotransporter translocation and assembly factor TamB
MMGAAAGEIRVNGFPDRLQGEARVQLEGMRFAGATVVLPPLIMTARTVVSGGRLDLNAALEGLTEGPARAAVQVSVSYALPPFSLAAAIRKPCRGELKVAADLARLSRIVPLDAQNLAGSLSVDLNLGGTLETPEIQRAFALRDGL